MYIICFLDDYCVIIKKLLYFIRSFLAIIYSKFFSEKLQLKLYPIKFYIKFRIFLRIRDLYLPVYLLTGREKESKKTLKVLFAGDEFIYLYLIKTIFLDVPKREYLADITIWNFNKKLKNLSCKADLTLLKTDRFFTRKLQKKGFIIIPDWIDSWIDLSVSKEEIFKNTKKSAREEVLKIKKYGYTYAFSSKPKDFEEFYKNFYTPFLQSRHGTLSYPEWWTLNYREMIGMFKGNRAKLLWVKDKNKFVAGVVMFNVKNIAYPIYMGIDITSDYWEKCGSSAIYYFSTLWAKENGFKMVRIGDVRSFFNDGLFQYKRKWGIFLNENYNRYGIIGLKINDYNSAVVFDFLENNPFIFSNKKQLKGFIYLRKNISAIETQNIFNEYYTKGLKTITIVANHSDLKQLFNNFDRWKFYEKISIPLNSTPNCNKTFSGILQIISEKDMPSALISYKKINTSFKIGNLSVTDDLKRFVEEYDLNIQQAEQVVSKGYQNDVEKLIQAFPNFKNIIVKTFLSTFSEPEKEKTKTENITYEMLESVFTGLVEKKFSKEAIPLIIDFFAKHKTNDVDLALLGCNLKSLDEINVEKIIDKIIYENLDFVKKEGMNSFSPLMGLIMKKIRGQFDGKIISKMLEDKIKKTTH